MVALKYLQPLISSLGAFLAFLVEPSVPAKCNRIHRKQWTYSVTAPCLLCFMLHLKCKSKANIIVARFNKGKHSWKSFRERLMVIKLSIFRSKTLLFVTNMGGAE